MKNINIKNKWMANRILKKSCKVLDILSEIGTKLIQENNNDNSIDYILDLIGNQFNLSRIIIFQDDNDRYLSKSIFSWFNKDVDICNTLDTILYYKHISWNKLLDANGRILSNNIKELPKDIYELLNSQKVASIIVYPLFINSKKSGFIRYDQCKANRKFTKEDYKIFSNLSNIISSIYSELINKREMSNRDKLLNYISDMTNFGTWKLNLQTNNYIIDEKYANLIGFDYKIIKLNSNLRNKVFNKMDLERSKLLIDEYIDGKTDIYECKIRIKHKNGKWIWFHEKGMVIEWDKNNKPITLFGIIIDITDYEDSKEEKLKLVEAIENTDTNIILTDKDGVIKYITQAYLKEKGYVNSDLIGKSIKILNSGAAFDTTFNDMWNTVNKGISWEGVLINRNKYGDICYDEIRISPVKDANNTITSFMAITRDVSQKKYLEEKQKQISIRDALTNLYNRKYLYDKLGQAIDTYKKNEDYFSVAIIDIDFFKSVNDNYGHIAGDFVLKEFAEVLINSIRTYDVLGRYGGEEFIIILQGISKESAEKVIERILNKIRNITFRFEDKDINITFSCGISDVYDINHHELNINNIIDVADKKLYIAKNSGRNRIIID